MKLNKKLRNSSVRLAVLAAATLALALPARADTNYWDGIDTTGNGTVDGGTGTWDTSTANWTTAEGLTNFAWDNTAGATNVARFQGTAAGVFLGGPITVGALSIGVAYDINTSAGALTLAGTGQTLFGNSTATLSGAGGIIVGANQTWTNEAATLLVSAPVSLNGNVLTLETRNNAMDVTGVISGNGGLTIKSSQGSGTGASNSGNPTLNNANDYTGITMMLGGYIWLNSGGLGALGFDTSDIIVSNGGFRLSGNGTIDRGLNLTGNCGLSKTAGTTTVNGSISGTGNLLISGNYTGGIGGGGAVVLAGENTLSGTVSVANDGTLRLAHTHALKNATLNATLGGARALLDLPSQNLAYVFGAVVGTNNLDLGTGLGNGGSGFVSVGNNNLNSAYLAAMSGTAGLTKIGAGTLSLLGTNLYTGDTVVSTGTLRLGHPTQSLDFALVGTTTTLRRILTNLTSTTELFVGQALSGTGVAANTVIVSIDSANQISVNNALVAGTTTATFAARSGAIAGSTNVVVAAGAILNVSDVTGGFAVNASQTLRGNGTVIGDVILPNNATLSPGASVGTLTNTGNITWQGGATYKWELSGTGAGEQDLLLISGGLTSTADSGNKFKIQIASLDSNGNPGAMSAGFNSSIDQSWKIATASGGVTGIQADAIAFIDDFTSYNGGSGTFTVTNIGNDVFVVYKAAFVSVPPTAGVPNPTNATTWVGGSATFTVSATGTGPLSHQWRFNGVDLAGETTASLTLNNLQEGQSGNYDCVVTSPYPPASTSSVAVLTVNRLVVNAHYRLGEAGVGVNNLPQDSSGAGHHFVTELDGTSVVVDSVQPAPGSSNYYVFNGTGGFSGIGWDPAEDNVGVECWVRVSDLGQTGKLIFGTGHRGGALGNGINLCFDGSGLNAALGFGAGIQTVFGLPYMPSSTEEWVHIAAVRNNGSLAFYVNGIQAGPSSATAPQASALPYLGMTETAGYFTGAIDEARIFTFAPGQFRVSDLGYYGGNASFTQVHPKPWFAANITDNFYLGAREFMQYSGWWDLWYRYRGVLPFGNGVHVAQVENSVPDINAFPDKFFTLDPIDALPNPDGHAETVGTIYYGGPVYQDSNATFPRGFGRGVTNIAAYTGNAFRSDVLGIDPGGDTRLGPLPAWNSGPRQVLNMSSSGGFGGDANTIRALDYLIDTYNVLGCNSHPGSYVGDYNGTLSGNVWNSLVIAQNGPRNANWNGAQYENVGTHFRVKPDLVSGDWMEGRTGGASSWTTPTVAGAAAFLLEQARSTNLTHAATNNYVLKSVMMAGASKFGLITPVWEAGSITNWDYETPYVYSNNPPTQPLDRLFGAGRFNINNAYTILTAGEASATGTNGPTGWAKGSGLTASAAQTYWINVTQPLPEFVAMLVWNRHVQDNAGTSYNWTLNNLKLELFNAANQLLASSDDPGNNVEQVYLPQGLGAGVYYLKVSSAGATAENYGLAWRTTAPTAVPTVVGVEPQLNGTVKVIAQGVPNQPYKLYQTTDLSFGFWTQVGAGTSDANGRVEMIDPAPPVDGAFYKAQFTY